MAVRWGLGMLCLVGMLACEQSPTVDHLARARELASTLEAQGVKDLADPAYEAVAQELQMVPRTDPKSQEATTWLKQLQDARRDKLFAIQDEGSNSGPTQKVAKASTQKRPPKKSGSANPPGWDPYETNIDMAAIEQRVKSGQATAPVASTAPKRSSKADRVGQAAVTIYTTSWCGVCKSAKSYMRSQGISFVEKDVEKDPSAAAEAAAKTGNASGVPVIDVGGQIMVGFEKSALEKMLKKAS